MNIDEASAILEERKTDWHTQNAAAAYVVSFYNEHRDRLRPVGARFTTDATTSVDASIKRTSAACDAIIRLLDKRKEEDAHA